MNSAKPYLLTLALALIVVFALSFVEPASNNLSGVAASCDPFSDEKTTEEFIGNEDDTLTVIQTNTCNSCIAVKNYAQDGALSSQEIKC